MIEIPLRMPQTRTRSPQKESRKDSNVRFYPLGHLSDEIIEAMLNELSIELGAALGQERIYVAFADRTWILDAGER